MRRSGGLGLLLAALAFGHARAGAWPEPAGQTQAILKYEEDDARDGFDRHGDRVPIAKVHDDDLILFVEHGLTSRLTFQFKGGYTSGEDQFVRFDGRAPIEFGLRYTFFQRPRTVLSVYVGGIVDGQGRNAGYAPPKQGTEDFEVRLLAGRSALVRRHEVFVDFEAARLVRGGLPDETRVDATAGLYLTKTWLVLLQSYSGQADAQGTPPDRTAPNWVKVELGLVRHFGPWSVQAGWRQTAYGHDVPVEGGPVIGLWRRF